MNYEKLMSKKNSDGKDAVDLLNEASDLMDKDKYKDASGLLTEAINLCGHPRMYFNRGYCYYQSKEKKKAIDDFKKSITNDRGGDLLVHEKQRLYLYLGITYEEMDNDDKAVDAYKRAADWGYSGAIARLEKMGVDYTPQPVDESSESKSAQANTASKSKQKNASMPKLKTAAASVSKQSGKNAVVSKITKNNIKTRFVLPAVIGIIFGICAFFIFSSISKKTDSAELSVIRASELKVSVTSDTLDLCAEPYSHSSVLKVLVKGNLVEITGDAFRDWTPVQHEGVKGWVKSDCINNGK